MEAKACAARFYGIDQGRPVHSPVASADYLELIERINTGEKGMQIVCPHCKQLARIRNSRQLSDVVREAYCQCQNVACGHTFKLISEIVETISPSAVPDPDVAKRLRVYKAAEGVSAD